MITMFQTMPLDEMHAAGVFLNLPLLPFKRILWFLPLVEKKKVRHLSTW
jgi:hypothetical protein